MSARRLSYAVQDAISKLIVGPVPIGTNARLAIRRAMADRLVADGYATLRADGKLEVTELAKTEYDAAIDRMKTHRHTGDSRGE